LGVAFGAGFASFADDFAARFGAAFFDGFAFEGLVGLPDCFVRSPDCFVRSPDRLVRLADDFARDALPTIAVHFLPNMPW
jgi:hypothetical protein